MSRYFAPITIDELKAKIDKSFPDGLSAEAIKEKLGQDLKVEFDGENFETHQEGSSVFGYHTLPNGFTFLGCWAAGDWEYPVAIVLYWDGKKIRGYVPMEGNPWNTTTKQAYGNDEDADGKNAHKRWPDIFDGSPLDDSGEFDANDDEMLKDIVARILPSPKGLPINTKAVLTAHLGKLKKTLEQRVKELKYYAPGDEASELFEQTLALCYSMSGLGDTEKAEELYKWAVEMAEASYKYAEEDDRLDDFINGQWGH